MSHTYSRRDVLAAAGVASVAGIAGCITGSNHGFRFSAYDAAEPLHRRFLTTDPTTQRAQFDVDYPADYKRAIYAELIETGSVAVVNYELAYRYEFGTEQRERPQFVVRDGNYYRVHVDEVREVDRDWWEFYLDLIDEEPPAGADRVTTPVDSLSERDRRIAQRAMEAAAADRDPAIDVGEREFGSRGVLYHDHLDHEESDLVPSPPFEYLRHGDHWFRARAERGTATLTERTFTAERVADSRTAYERHLLESVLDVDFSTASLSDAATDVLDTATDGPFYGEEPPMSEGLASVLELLGEADQIGPHAEYGEYTTFPNMYGVYEGTWYEFDLAVYP
jgi:hypothetical protein